ncbi:hypothetical protein E1832_07430 [Antarcticimicrobium luteum]|uniref:HPt domain-containing protein n=1 Tax=Antarcticimicrobium luteum TaxID=2547397 RepID=A0A4R5VD88_9RHOB|nr:hypothetical protein E1832_07430 [Antarcticimicrobium luteum]
MVQGLDADKAAQLNAGLARIRERFVQSLSDRIDAFYELLGDLRDPGSWQDACAEIRASAHKLHGICASVGFSKIGQNAAQVEYLIDGLGPTLRERDIDEVRSLLNLLLDEMEQHLDAA